MQGSFSEAALEQFAALAEEKAGVNFSENDTYDFTRCVRANGSAYGTGGKCRLGTEEAKEIQPSKKHKEAADTGSNGEKKTKMRITAKIKALPTEKLYKVLIDPRITDSQKKLLQKHIDEREKQEEIKPPSKAKTNEPKKEVDKGAYATLMKKQQELVQKGDIAGAMKLNDKIKFAMEKVKESPGAKEADEKLKKVMAAKRDEQEAFALAQAKREAGQIAAGLNAKDKKVISDYTKETMGQSARSYDNMNGCLRSPPSCPDVKTSKKFVKEFDSVLDKLPKNGSGDKFYRGVQVIPGQTEQLYKELEKATPGLRMKDPGYGSYSAERKQAEHFTNRNRPNIIFVTRSKSITPINMYSDIKMENEAILPRGTEQTVRKVTKEGNNLIVELD